MVRRYFLEALLEKDPETQKRYIKEAHEGRMRDMELFHEMQMKAMELIASNMGDSDA